MDPAYFTDVLSRFLTGTDESRCTSYLIFRLDKDGFLQEISAKLLRTLSQIKEELKMIGC